MKVEPKEEQTQRELEEPAQIPEEEPTPVSPSDEGSEASNNLELRLNNANRYFRKMAAAVFNDDEAIKLLRSMYRAVLVENEAFDFQQNGHALARLAAANFCELGPTDIYITQAGQRFIDNLGLSKP